MRFLNMVPKRTGTGLPFTSIHGFYGMAIIIVWAIGMEETMQTEQLRDNVK